MDIVAHIAIANFYREGMGYQENILPIKHKEIGCEAVMISCNQNEGKRQVESYTNIEGLKVYLLPKKKNLLMRIPVVNCMVNKISGLQTVLEEVQPTIIFMHGLQAVDNLDVINYIKNHPLVTLYVDQHADFYNTPIKTLKQYITQKIIYKQVANKLLPYVKKFWGVTPWRVDYLRQVYNLPIEKTDLLVMGGDENLIDWNNREKIRSDIRKTLGIPEDAFVLITGGKLGKAKNLHILLEALRRRGNKNSFLIVFGKFEEEEYHLCEPYIDDHVKLLGWIDSRGVYPYFLSADVSVFPGTHSVLWEQSCAAGLPGIFKDWNGGFNHVDVGGNALLIKDITVDSISNAIEKVMNRTFYQGMKEVAENKGRTVFSYKQIAKRSIER